MLDHFRFLKAVATVTPKMTIPSPSVLHFRGGRKAIIDRTSIPTWIPSIADTAEAYRKAVHAFYDAGCRYLQLDDTVWAYLCSEKERQAVRDRGEDPDALPAIYRDMIHHAIKDRPRDMTVTTHVCRGNFRSTWISEGGYEPVAEILLGETDYDGYFLEYDTDRAGGFEPLRFLPKGKKARRARPRHLEDRRPGGEGRDRARASRRRRNMRRSSSSASPRNAASPRPRREISSPRRRNGRSSR